MKTLKVKNLCKTYIVNKKQNNVLRNINFEIKDGSLEYNPSFSNKINHIKKYYFQDNSL